MLEDVVAAAGTSDEEARALQRTNDVFWTNDRNSSLHDSTLTEPWSGNALRVH